MLKIKFLHKTMHWLVSRSLLVVLNFVFLHCCYAQDTTYNKLKFSIQTFLSGRQIFEEANASIKLPENIKHRRSQSANAISDFNSITDNPIKHGAYYGYIKTTLRFSAMRLNIDIYGEHRGVSYGVFNTKNMIVYPVISAHGSDTFFVGRKKIFVEGKVGHFLNEKLDEGLLIYNIDLQGIQGKLVQNKWSVIYTLYGDLYNGIGLNIDDMHALSFKRKFFSNQKSITEAAISLNTIAASGQKVQNNFIWSFSAKKQSKRNSVYFQIGIRNHNKETVNFEKGLSKQIGFVFGDKFEIKSNRFLFSNRIEIRYYGKSFNASRFSDTIRYRKVQQSLFANTIGNHLYPLRKFDTSFSQWAVFTEYQGINVASMGANGVLRYNLSEKSEVSFYYDFNKIIAGRDSAYLGTKTNNFFYSFFTFGFYYKPVKGVKVGLILTNKGMNLDIGYPTFYLYRKPYFGIQMSFSMD